MKTYPGISVLLTGASGVIGSALLNELDDASVTCLVHRTPIRRSGVDHVRGDISRPRLGLTRAEFALLADRVDVVVHAAAMTDFTADESVTTDLNVNGTANVLEFAARADAPLYYVSTAFVQRASQLRDIGDCGGPSAYLRSKHAAEQLVSKSGIPAVVIRPSVVIGDSDSGQIAAFQGLHAIAGAMLKGVLPLVPLLPDALIDFVPQDYVADAIASLLRSGQQDGEYWLTAGDQALRASDMVDACMEVADSLGGSIDAPRLIAPDAVDRLIRPVFIEPLPEQARNRFDHMLNTTALFSADAAFPSSAAELERRFGLVLPADLRATFVRSLEFWATQRGLVAPLGSESLPVPA